mmetsp:Transcript_62501/g.191169  ORF Transcript_62501/g.191169 Transcript_62501/m.191169 type:complete len:384 (+) Transcript_62501:165-1316(+)
MQLVVGERCLHGPGLHAARGPPLRGGRVGRPRVGGAPRGRKLLGLGGLRDGADGFVPQNRQAPPLVDGQRHPGAESHFTEDVFEGLHAGGHDPRQVHRPGAGRVRGAACRQGGPARAHQRRYHKATGRDAFVQRGHPHPPVVGPGVRVRDLRRLVRLVRRAARRGAVCNGGCPGQRRDHHDLLGLLVRLDHGQHDAALVAGAAGRPDRQLAPAAAGGAAPGRRPGGVAEERRLVAAVPAFRHRARLLGRGVRQHPDRAVRPAAAVVDGDGRQQVRYAARRRHPRRLGADLGGRAAQARHRRPLASVPEEDHAGRLHPGANPPGLAALPGRRGRRPDGQFPGAHCPGHEPGPAAVVADLDARHRLAVRRDGLRQQRAGPRDAPR